MPGATGRGHIHGPLQDQEAVVLVGRDRVLAPGTSRSRPNTPGPPAASRSFVHAPGSGSAVQPTGLVVVCPGCHSHRWIVVGVSSEAAGRGRAGGHTPPVTSLTCQV